MSGTIYLKIKDKTVSEIYLFVRLVSSNSDNSEYHSELFYSSEGVGSEWFEPVLIMRPSFP